MSEKISVDQYGRKQWNLDAYSNDSKEKDKSTNTSGVYKLKSNEDYIDHRETLLKELIDSVKQHTLITGSGVSATPTQKNKLFGFFCPVCEYSYRDNMALIDHLNSPQHIAKVKGSTADGELNAGVRRATDEEVKQMLDFLVNQDSKKLEKQESFKERVKKREEFEKKETSKEAREEDKTKET